jgi:lipoprotein-anchoring transpeptidase ErfK/SrfK
MENFGEKFGSQTGFLENLQFFSDQRALFYFVCNMDQMVFHSIKKNKSGLLYFSVAIVIFSLAAFGVALGIKTYAQNFRVTAEMASGELLDPEDPVIINFSEAIKTDDFQKAISIVPETPVRFQWENRNHRLTITPENYWKIGGNYSVNIQDVRSAMMTFGSAQFIFGINNYPQVTGFMPEDGAQDVLIDIEDPITIDFSQPLENYKIKVTTAPFQEMAYQMNEEKNEIRLVPQKNLDSGKHYSIELFIRYKKENQFQKIYTTGFTTQEPLPEKWSQDLAVRVEQAKKFTQPQIKEGKYIDVNLTSQVMTIFENGTLLDAYLISTGKRGMPTPEGTFQIANKTPRAYSKSYGLYMPYWMALVSSGKFGIHELPEWPSGYKEGAAHLGIPVSHGCVRLGVGPAERVYNWAELKTPVVVHY